MSAAVPKPRILWIDDEIDLLKPHIMFLNERGYDVETVGSGTDAVDLLEEKGAKWDLIMLDENMPGLSGLETLNRLKILAPHTPVVMITKSEEENIMDRAVGNQITDYLIKPVNPRQILSSLKKILHSEQLITEEASNSYRREFIDISNLIGEASSFSRWADIYKRLTLRDIELSENAPDIARLLRMQFDEAQKGFFRFIKSDYLRWFGEDSADSPLMCHRFLDVIVRPSLEKDEKVILMVIDNLRLDQWLTVKPFLLEQFDIEKETIASALLPTATQYCRNAIFSGLLPEEIEKRYPHLWIDEDDPESKNLNEEPLTREWLDRNGFRNKSLRFYKANDSSRLQKIIKEFDEEPAHLTVVVLNFIDILSHAGTDSPMVRELASNDAAYRALSSSWFRHSPVKELLRKIALRGTRFCITTDHGSIRVTQPVKVVADKETNTALRYKLGKNLLFPAKDVFEIRAPKSAGLPAPGLSTSYIFAKAGDYFVYPNNFNQYVRFFRDTYQHGGVSMEEMLLPVVTLKSKL